MNLVTKNVLMLQSMLSVCHRLLLVFYFSLVTYFSYMANFHKSSRTKYFCPPFELAFQRIKHLHSKDEFHLSPIYHLMVEAKIVSKSYCWVLFYLIPFIGIRTRRRKQTGSNFYLSFSFKIELLLLSYLFSIILSFDDSKYTPPIDSVPSDYYAR